MPGVNDFKPFAISDEAAIVSQNVWNGPILRPRGNVPGTIANSALLNKALRQATLFAAALGELIVHESPQNAMDDGDPVQLYLTLKNALANMGLGAGGIDKPVGLTEISVYGFDPATNEFLWIPISELIGPGNIFQRPEDLPVPCNGGDRAFVISTSTWYVCRGDGSGWDPEEPVTPPPPVPDGIVITGPTANINNILGVTSINNITLPVGLLASNPIYFEGDFLEPPPPPPVPPVDSVVLMPSSLNLTVNVGTVPPPIGDANIGDSVMIPVDGVPREFLVVHKGNPDSSLYPSEFDNGVIVMMKDLYSTRQWHTQVSNGNSYSNSAINTWLNNDFYNLIDSSISAQIINVRIPYRPGAGTSVTVNSGINGLSSNVFLLAGSEVGWITSGRPIDGSILDYFIGLESDSGNSKRIANFNGTATAWWLRTPGDSQSAAGSINTGGGASISTSVVTNNGIRPCLVLPASLVI